MGRIRQTAIKRTAAAIVEQNDKLPKKFEAVKEHLKTLNVFDSVKVRNRVAGYIVTILRKKKF